MKKQLLFPCLLLMLTLTLTTAFGQLTVIPKLGSSFTTFALSDDMLDGEDKPDYKFGLVLGGALEIGINDRLAIQPELLFIQKGAKEEITGDGYTAKTSIKLNYLEVPILIKLKFGNVYVNAGPSIGFGLGGRYDLELHQGSDSYDVDGDVKFGDGDNEEDIYMDNAIDFGLQVGGGVKAGPVVIDLRYGLGLSNINDEEEGFSGDWKFKNSAFQLTVGYPIPLGSK